jgi:hypothetical protein
MDVRAATPIPCFRFVWIGYQHAMFALIAAIIWFLAAFGVHIGSVNLLLLGLAFLGLHFAWAIGLPTPWSRQP